MNFTAIFIYLQKSVVAIWWFHYSGTSYICIYVYYTLSYVHCRSRSQPWVSGQRNRIHPVAMGELRTRMSFFFFVYDSITVAVSDIVDTNAYYWVKMLPICFLSCSNPFIGFLVVYICLYLSHLSGDRTHLVLKIQLILTHRSSDRLTIHFKCAGLYLLSFVLYAYLSSVLYLSIENTIFFLICL